VNGTVEEGSVVLLEFGFFLFSFSNVVVYLVRLMCFYKGFVAIYFPFLQKKIK